MNRRRQVLAVSAAVLTLSGLGVVGVGIAAQHGTPPQLPARGELAEVGPVGGGPSSADSGGTPTPGPGDRSGPSRMEGMVGPLLPASPPRRIHLPTLDVTSGLEQLRTGDGGQLTVPQDPDSAGWFTGGPTPGSPGPSIIAGHVTWDRAPAVFFDLADLRPGDPVEVERSDGTTAVFTVSRLGEYDKVRFPTEQVYGAIDHAGLRLITCGGEYDDRARRYDANLVVFARLTGVRNSGVTPPR